MNAAITIIDVHSHPLTATYANAHARDANGGGLFDASPPDSSLGRHLDMLDAHGIAAGMFSQPALPDVLTGKEGHALARTMTF